MKNRKYKNLTVIIDPSRADNQTIYNYEEEQAYVYAVDEAEAEKGIADLEGRGILISEDATDEDETHTNGVIMALHFYEKALNAAAAERENAHKEAHDLLKMFYNKDMPEQSGAFMHALGFVMGMNEGLKFALETIAEE